jgi:hypothetical protein
MAAFVEALEAARYEPLSEADLVRLLERAARRGSVQACTFLLRRLNRDRQQDARAEPDPLAEFDAASPITDLLAARHRRGAA